MKLQSFRVQLNAESAEFALQEGTEIFQNSKSLRPEDTLQTKIMNSAFGTYAQQLLIEKVGARRVTREEVPNFSHDVVCDHAKLAEFAGWWSGSDAPTGEVKVEIKSLHMEGRKWVSFHDRNFKHAMLCAKNKWFDYLMAFGVTEVDRMNWIADVQLLAIVTPHALVHESSFARSQYEAETHYLRPREVHSNDWGKVYI